MPPPKHAPQVGVETIAPASTKTSSRPSRERLPVDPLRRRDDDRAASRGCTRAAAQDLGRLAQVGHRPVRAVADVDLVDLAARPPRRAGRRCPGECGSATSGAQRVEVDPQTSAANSASASDALGRPGPLGAAVEVRRRSSRRPGRGPSRRRPRRPCSRRRAARRSLSAAAPSPTNSSTVFVPPATPISAITARIRSLPVTNGCRSPVNSTWIVPGTACQNSPVREAGGDVGRAEPGAEGAERAVRAGVRVAAGDHRARDDPALLDEHGVLDPAAALVVVGDALRVGPLLRAASGARPSARPSPGRSGRRRRRPWPGRRRARAHPLHRPERDGPGDVVRHARRRSAPSRSRRARRRSVGVGEEDLLGERQGHRRRRYYRGSSRVNGVRCRVGRWRWTSCPRPCSATWPRSRSRSCRACAGVWRGATLVGPARDRADAAGRARERHAGADTRRRRETCSSSTAAARWPRRCSEIVCRRSRSSAVWRGSWSTAR